jgi:hypothetical protein
MVICDESTEAGVSYPIIPSVAPFSSRTVYFSHCLTPFCRNKRGRSLALRRARKDESREQCDRQIDHESLYEY